jgi:hypothetical protein
MAIPHKSEITRCQAGREAERSACGDTQSPPGDYEKMQAAGRIPVRRYTRDLLSDASTPLADVIDRSLHAATARNCGSFASIADIGVSGLAHPSRWFARKANSALRRELGGSHQSIETIMNWTGASERTIKNWLSGSNGPNGMHLIDVIRHSDAVCRLVMRMAGRGEALTTVQLGDLRTRMIGIIADIDRLESMPRK